MPYSSGGATKNEPLNLTRSHPFQKGRDVLVIVGFWHNFPAVLAAIICLYFLLLITGIILNGLVCYVMIKSKRYLRNISSFFITHMAAVDLFCRVVFTPLMMYTSLPAKEEQSPIPCKISAFVSSSCTAAIFGSLVVIAIDRYHNIIHPLTSLKTEKRPFYIGLLVWLYSTASSVMFFYTAQNVQLQKLLEGRVDRVGDPTSCAITPDFIGSLSVTISAVMTFFVPLLILIITYTAIFVSLRRRCRNGLVQSVALKSKEKAARMLVLVVLGFVMCFGPSSLFQMLRSYKVLIRNSQSASFVIIILVTDILELCSSLFNPLIYTFYSQDFRKDLLKICNTSSIRGKINVCNGKVCEPRAPKSYAPKTTGLTLATTTL